MLCKNLETGEVAEASGFKLRNGWVPYTPEEKATPVKEPAPQKRKAKAVEPTPVEDALDTYSFGE